MPHSFPARVDLSPWPGAGSEGGAKPLDKVAAGWALTIVKSISVITACYNEEANVDEVYLRVRTVIASLERYTYKHIFIDNASTDGTVAALKRLAAVDPNLKIIANSRNFGQIRSPMHAIHQARGDAVVCLVADSRILRK